MNTISLENDHLRLTFAPEFGGKIVSILERATGVEYLLPPAGEYGAQGADLNFAGSDRGGFDECLPSVARCGGTASTPPVPDHGELWHIPWQVLETSPDVVLSAQCALSGLHFERSVSLSGSKIHLRYQLRNRSGHERKWLWSSHPLLSVAPGDRIVLADEVRQVEVEFSTSSQIRQRGVVNWPKPFGSEDGTDLSVVGPVDGKTAHKLFAAVGKNGWCALQKVRENRILLFRFDPKSIPYVGIWICCGAWPEHGSPKQYTVALEPCTGNCDSLESAIRNGTARTLAPNESIAWDLQLEIISGLWNLDRTIS